MGETSGDEPSKRRIIRDETSGDETSAIPSSTLVFIKNKYRNRMDIENDMRCAISETPQGLKNLLNKNSYILHIDRAVLIKLSFFIILENCCFSSMVVRRNVGGVIIHKLAKGGHGVKSLRTPEIDR